MDLSNKVAIVTGSARGIGQAIALKLAEVGATVVVNDVGDAESLENVAAEIRAMPRPSLAVIADVSSPADVARLVETTLAAHGRIDAVVNNTGLWDVVGDFDIIDYGSQPTFNNAGTGTLRKVGVKGDDEALDQVVADWDGHALTLSLLGAYLAE